MNLNLIPYPKEINLKEEEHIPRGISGIKISGDVDGRIISYAEAKIEESGRVLEIIRDKILSGNDEYRLSADSESIKLVAGSDSGAFYGLKTLEQITSQFSNGFVGEVHDIADLKMRIQHVDLKKLDWNFNYLLELMDRFGSLKINYILLEYEDKFKFDFCDRIPLDTAFSKAQIAELEKKAAENFISIIPLVQCIGHFEYILKHEKYSHIRENSAISAQACPLKDDTFELFKLMAGEVIEAHPGSEYFHIGADEPFLLGTCPECAEFAKKQSKGRLYAEFINKIIAWVIEEKGKIPLFWSDILEHYEDAAELCRKDAIVVEWSYRPERTREKEIKFAPVKTSRMTENVFKNEFTESQHERFDKYLDYNPATGDFDSLPFVDYLQDSGFQVIGASNINSVDNILTHSRKACASKTPGHLATYWASANTNKPPYAIFENRFQGICMLGGSSWNYKYEQENRDTFFKRVAAHLAGTQDYSLLYELLNETGHFISPNNNNANGDDYFVKLAEVLKLNAPENNINLKLNMLFLKKTALEKELETCRKKEFVKPLLPEDCFSKIDITSFSNGRFSNTDEHPGWTGIYQNDLRFIPKGDVCFNGIPFSINNDNADGAAHSLIMVGDDINHTGFPREIRGVKIGRKADVICFLHSHVEGNAQSNGYYGKYILTYENGLQEEIPLLYHKNMGEWWKIVEIEDASIGWSGKNLKGVEVGQHLYQYYPECPDMEIKTLDFICESKTVLSLSALTIISNPPDEKEVDGQLVKQLKDFRNRVDLLQKEMTEILPHFLACNGVKSVDEISFEFTKKAIERILRLLNK